ncbi:contactin-3-like, partial [Actinia tenebrosa]|uniref:Contactin-3-like n=1 Tax=Actinia tenebrosa TaxID=6105 RepID=A0A6P8I626_ACTTE
MSDYLSKHKTLLLNVTLTKTNVTGLHPYTEYLVGVAAYNSKGVDQTLATIENVKTIRTLEGAPSAASGLTAKFISSSDLEIQWELIPNEKANGVLLGYRYVVYDNQFQIVMNGTVSNSTNSTQIKDMKRCADYTVYLRAWTAAGIGKNAVFNITNICAPPKIINHKQIVIVTPNKAAVLHCNYTGFPAPSVTWMIND